MAKLRKGIAFSSMTIVLVVILFVCLIAYIFIPGSSLGFVRSYLESARDYEKFRFEKLNEAFNEASLIPKDKLRVYQGSSLPDTEDVPPLQYDEHESLPTVDGKTGSSKAMFMMAFNKCDPSCCPSTYSCSGGCVA